MRFEWRKDIPDLAAYNSAQIEEIHEYKEMLEADECADEFEILEDELILE